MFLRQVCPVYGEIGLAEFELRIGIQRQYVERALKLLDGLIKSPDFKKKHGIEMMFAPARQRTGPNCLMQELLSAKEVGLVDQQALVGQRFAVGAVELEGAVRRPQRFLPIFLGLTVAPHVRPCIERRDFHGGPAPGEVGNRSDDLAGEVERLGRRELDQQIVAILEVIGNCRLAELLRISGCAE